jgi:hypothetical protein
MWHPILNCRTSMDGCADSVTSVDGSWSLTSGRVSVLTLRAQIGSSRGGMNFGTGMPTRFFLEDAVQVLLAGKSPGVSETRPYGCTIVREALE